MSVCNKLEYLSLTSLFSPPYLRLTTWKVLHLGMLWAYLQTLDYVGKACHLQTLKYWMLLNVNILNYFYPTIDMKEYN
jgi:hypothetical protein